MDMKKVSLQSICSTNFTTEFLNSLSYNREEKDILHEYDAICSLQNSSIRTWIDRLWQDHPEYMYPNKFLRLCLSPILLSLGTFGNIFSLIILTRRRESTYLYLAVLALTDLLVLYVGLLRLWIAELTVDIQDTANWLCKAVNYLGLVSSDASAWLIIAVTVERCIAVCSPMSATRMCNKRRARYLILIVILAACVINTPILFTLELKTFIQDGSRIFLCEASEGYEMFVHKVWPWFDAAIYSFVPFLLIIIINTLIIKETISATKRRESLQGVRLLQRSSIFSRGSIMSSQQKSFRQSKRLIFILMALSFTFLVTTLPMNILQVVSAFLRETERTPEEYALYFAKYTLGRTIVELLMYMNHTINFFLYCATGSKFRRQIRTMSI